MNLVLIAFLRDDGRVFIIDLPVRASYQDMARAIRCEDAFIVCKLPSGDSVMYGGGSANMVAVEGHLVSLPFIIFRQGEYTQPESPKMTPEELREFIGGNIKK